MRQHARVKVVLCLDSRIISEHLDTLVSGTHENDINWYFCQGQTDLFTLCQTIWIDHVSVKGRLQNGLIYYLISLYSLKSNKSYDIFEAKLLGNLSSGIV